MNAQSRSNSVQVTWSRPEPEECTQLPLSSLRYFVLLSDNQGARVNAAETTFTSFIFVNLTSDTSYIVEVIAVIGNNIGPSIARNFSTPSIYIADNDSMYQLCLCLY